MEQEAEEGSIFPAGWIWNVGLLLPSGWDLYHWLPGSQTFQFALDDTAVFLGLQHASGRS